MEPQQTNYTQAPNPKIRRSWLIYAGLTLLMVVMLAAGLIIHSKHHPKQVTSSEVTITITDNGFVPATLLIKPSTQVTWHNASKNVQQVSIDTYRGSAKSPVLNKSSEITAGNVYALSFSQVGTYIYSDPLNPGHTGQIEVK